ncbi:hypothetical protein CFC21_018043, partial [Triticum aestivum]
VSSVEQLFKSAWIFL